MNALKDGFWNALETSVKIGWFIVENGVAISIILLVLILALYP